MYRKAHIENGRITWTREVTGEDIFLAVAVLSSISSIYLLFWS